MVINIEAIGIVHGRNPLELHYDGTWTVCMSVACVFVCALLYVLCQHDLMSVILEMQ